MAYPKRDQKRWPSPLRRAGVLVKCGGHQEIAKEILADVVAYCGAEALGERHAPHAILRIGPGGLRYCRVDAASQQSKRRDGLLFEELPLLGDRGRRFRQAGHLRANGRRVLRATTRWREQTGGDHAQTKKTPHI